MAQAKSPFAPLVGEAATPFHLIATLAAALGGAALVLLAEGVGPKAVVLAVLAADYAAGVVSNAAASTRSWWRARPRLTAWFHAVHLAQIPLVVWLAGPGMTAAVLVGVIALKLAVFRLGEEG